MKQIFLLAAVALVACGGDDERGGTDGQGGRGGGIGEGGAGGGVAAPAGIRVMNTRGVGEAGIDVIIQEANGAVVSHHETDAAGLVDAARVEGQQVSVVWTEAGEYGPTRNVSTVAGAPIDVELRFIVSPMREPPGSPMPVTIVAQTTQAWDVVVQGSCLASSMIGSGTFDYTPCPNSDTFDIVAYFLPGEASWQVFPGLTVTPGAPINLNVDINLAEAAPRIPVIIGDVPENASSVVGVLSAHRPDGGMNQTFDAVEDYLGTFPDLITVPRVYAPPGSRIEHRTGFALWGGHVTQMTSTWHDDIQAEMRAEPVSIATFAGLGHDPDDSRSFHWEIAPGERGDAVRVEVSLPPVSSTAPDSYPRRWTVHVPAAHSEVTLPQLPPSFHDWAAHGAWNSVMFSHVDAIGQDGVAAVSNARADGASLQWHRVATSQ